MMMSIHFLIYFLVVLQFNSNIIFSQRNFSNPAVTDPAPCACDLRANACDPDCCCDLNCDNSDLNVSSVCRSVRTVSSYSSSQERNLQTWNCSNSTSDALYDYFPFVCVQLKLNEVIGQFYSTDNVTFLATNGDATNLRSTFVNEYPELFQPTTLTSTSSTTGNYSIGAPVQMQSGPFTLPGSLIGSICQDNVNVLFGVNRDFSCTSITSSLCSTVSTVTSVWRGSGTSVNVSISLFTKSYTSPSNTTRDLTTEYYFQDSCNQNINNIPFTSGSIDDYCPLRYPITRTQRYSTACNSSSGCINNQYQTWSGCALRDNFAYSAIPDNFFCAGASSIDGSTNFADFDNATNTTSASLAASCSGIDIRRVFYRFNYSSVDNTISTVEAFVLTQTRGAASFNPRITIEWNDITVNPAINSTIPRGYLVGENLQFRRNGNPSDVSNLVPTSDGYCIDATRRNLRYKQSTLSYCFIQLTQNTIEQCHNLKLNMYLYLNIFYAPASQVLAYPNATATLIPIRDDYQDSIDLDRIDETRPNNRLNRSSIIKTELNTSSPAIYDTTGTLPACYNVPSGIYIEFGFVRVSISPTVSFERIVSVRYNYTYSNWQFDCTAVSCDNTSTQKYLVTFQSAFVDYTNAALNMTDLTTSDLTSADNYIQHLLWLITPEYKGEPGYRNYTIAMILIFIAISVVVIHVLLFGFMFPF